MAAQKVCSAEKRSKARPVPTAEKLDWIMQNLEHSGERCLIWPFGSCGKGYGQIQIGGRLGRRQNASRVMCIEAHGLPPTEKHEAAHSCGNGSRGCVHPGHLSWKTHAENGLDMKRHGSAPRGVKSPRARLTEQQVREIREASGSHAAIGRRYGVGAGAVFQIVHHKTWKHVS